MKKNLALSPLLLLYIFPYGKANIWLVEIRVFLLHRSRAELEWIALPRIETNGQMLEEHLI